MWSTWREGRLEPTKAPLLARARYEVEPKQLEPKWPRMMMMMMVMMMMVMMMI